MVMQLLDYGATGEMLAYELAQEIPDGSGAGKKLPYKLSKKQGELQSEGGLCECSRYFGTQRTRSAETTQFVMEFKEAADKVHVQVQNQ